MKILIIDLIKFFVHDQVFLFNKFNKECITLKQILSKDKTTLKEILLKKYKVKKEIFYYHSKL